MKSRILICILLCLAILATGMAAAQDELVVVADKATYEAAVREAAQAYCPPFGQTAAASETYGTKVKAGDPDIGLPLSIFSPVGAPGATQFNAWISYWDVNANSIYDDQDVPYLQFGSINQAGARFVRANNIRLAGWGSYLAGSYVKQGDADIGQPLGVTPPATTPTMPALPATPLVFFYYMDVTGSAGYDLGDPVYLKVLSPGAIGAQVGTNDIRITGNAGFPAGSKVSLNDPDAGKPLTVFKPSVTIPASGGPFAASPTFPIGGLMFYNANGNVLPPLSLPIFDDGDVVYFHHGLGAALVVSPNDIRLY